MFALKLWRVKTDCIEIAVLIRKRRCNILAQNRYKQFINTRIRSVPFPNNSAQMLSR